MRRGAAMLLVALLLTAGREASADEDEDLDRLPKDVQKAPLPATPATPNGPHPKLYVEDVFTLPSAARAVPVAFPAAPFRWQNRTSFDAYLQWEPWKRVTITASDRLNVFEQDNVAFLSRQTVRNDFREGYASWEPASGSYIEAGRINLRNGVALGFNPTDFFKTRSLVGQASLDPSVLRQNRLGTVMARAQTIWAGGSASVAFAPKLTDPAPVVANDPPGVDPRFDATNAAYRVFCTFNLDIANLTPQALAYFELHRSKVGLNLTRQLGDAVIAYAEWAGGPESNLIARSLAYGKETRTLPANTPVLPPTNTSTEFRNDVAAGASWTIATKVTLNLEYHFHQAGFTPRNWQDWFDSGGGAPRELWFIRGYASDQQEPVPMHQAFVRATWPRALLNDLELTSFAFVDLLDGSLLEQVSATYFISDRWTFAAYGTVNVGPGRTERGSFPQRASAILQLVRYL